MFLKQNKGTGFWTSCHTENEVTDETYVGELRNVHFPQACDGPRGCAIHNHPSNHALNEAPMVWREDRGILERICEHNVGHPDHDSALYLTSIGQEDENIHTCDGCCL